MAAPDPLPSSISGSAPGPCSDCRQLLNYISCSPLVVLVRCTCTRKRIHRVDLCLRVRHYSLANIEKSTDQVLNPVKLCQLTEPVLHIIVGAATAMTSRRNKRRRRKDAGKQGSEFHEGQEQWHCHPYFLKPTH